MIDNSLFFPTINKRINKKIVDYIDSLKSKNNFTIYLMDNYEDIDGRIPFIQNKFRIEAAIGDNEKLIHDLDVIYKSFTFNDEFYKSYSDKILNSFLSFKAKKKMNMVEAYLQIIRVYT